MRKILRACVLLVTLFVLNTVRRALLLVVRLLLRANDGLLRVMTALGRVIDRVICNLEEGLDA